MTPHGRLLLSQGDQVAGYVIDSYVARGGMAVVYRARDTGLGRFVALKLIAPELAENEKFRMRFIRESEMAAAIDHPNILPIYAAGEAQGMLYIAMRYVDGEDLGAILASRGALSPDVVLPLFTQVAAALDTAHTHGLVHRDVKPGNILVARSRDEAGESHVYLTDFGLTKRSSSLSGLTTAGHFMGTIAYVAPEQIAGRSVDSRADVYAMGCILYEALAGVPPFQRDDDAAMLWAHMSDHPESLTSLRPELPAEIDGVLSRAMAKSPDERTPSCRAVISELRSAFRSVRLPAPPPLSIPAPARRPAQPQDEQPPQTHVLHDAPAPSVRQPVSPVQQPVPAGPQQGPAGPQQAPAGPQQVRPAPAVTTPGRRRSWALPAAAIIVVAALIAGAFWFFQRGDGDYVAYDGTRAGAEWLTFDKPTRWATHPTSVGVCFCTQHLGPAFEYGDATAWERADAAPMNGSADLDGMYVRTTETPPPTSATAAQKVVQDQLHNNTVTTDTVQTASIDGKPGWRVNGSVESALNPGTRFAFRYYLVATGSQTDHLLLFTRSGAADFDSTADHVIQSTTLAAS